VGLNKLGLGKENFQYIGGQPRGKHTHDHVLGVYKKFHQLGQGRGKNALNEKGEGGAMGVSGKQKKGPYGTSWGGAQGKTIKRNNGLLKKIGARMLGGKKPWEMNWQALLRQSFELSKGEITTLPRPRELTPLPGKKRTYRCKEAENNIQQVTNAYQKRYTPGGWKRETKLRESKMRIPAFYPCGFPALSRTEDWVQPP